jgi:hypothetical protein
MLAHKSDSVFLAAAQYLLSIGLCPVLLDGKKPIFSNYTDYLAGVGGADEVALPVGARPLRYSNLLLEAWAREFPWANLGLLCRERPTIDIDNDHIWSAIRDIVPFTPHIKRGARGFSLIYSQSEHDPVMRTRTFVNQFSKDMVLEVLAHGRQTVLPPSIHPDTGAPYAWIALPDLGVMSPAPLSHIIPPALSQATVDAIEARLAALGITKRRVERGEGLARELAAGERGRYEAYLAPKLAERITAVRQAPGGGRQDALNGACFALAPWVRTGFVDEVELEIQMREACSLNGYVGEHGDKAFTRQFAKALDEGWMTELPDLDAGRAAQLMGPAPLLPAHLVGQPSHLTPSGQPSGQIATNVPVEFWTYDGTLPDEEPELIRRLLPATAGHLAFVAGQSGMGKSFYISAMAVALGMGPGTLFFGHPVRERVGTIIVAAEGAGGMRARLFAAAQAMGATGSLPIIVIPRCGNLCLETDRMTMKAALIAAAAHIQQAYGVRVGAVVLDTMLAAFGMEDEGASAEAQRICGYMRELGACVNAVIVPVHHVGKDGAQGMRGSSAFYAAAEYVVICGGSHDHETGKTENRYLAIDKSRNDGTGPICNVELQIINLGLNRYGDIRTTCFYAGTVGEVDPKSHKKDKTHGLHDAVFTRAYDAVLTRDGGEGVSDMVLRLQFYLLSHAGSQDAKKKAYQRTRDKMIAGGIYKIINGIWVRETLTGTFR